MALGTDPQPGSHTFSDDHLVDKGSPFSMCTNQAFLAFLVMLEHYPAAFMRGVNAFEKHGIQLVVHILKMQF